MPSNLAVTVRLPPLCHRRAAVVMPARRLCLAPCASASAAFHLRHRLYLHRAEQQSADCPSPFKAHLCDFGYERINGRLAMLGFVVAIAMELAKGKGVFEQISDGGIPLFEHRSAPNGIKLEGSFHDPTYVLLILNPYFCIGLFAM
ncbi:hypothetical protein SESBI_08425 [Sesbania bispinosa]|nr:hypothetical protein SESBI_08425 [Sesbania bispinosa]